MKTPSLKTALSKTALPLLFAATALTSLNVFAHDDTQKHCYPLAHGEEGMGSSNSIYAPFVLSRGNGQIPLFFISNTSNKNINVKVTFRTWGGENYVPTKYLMSGGFSNSNSPFNVGNGGAILKPFESGRIRMDNNEFDSLLGKITWQADACLETALVGAMANQYMDSRGFDKGFALFNGGNPF